MSLLMAQPVLCFDCYDIKISADPIRVGYEMTVYTTLEGDTFVELCAIIYEPITGVAPRPFVISYATSDDSAGNYSKNVIRYCIDQDLLSGYLIIVAPGDYVSDSGLLMFVTGDDRQCHRVQIVNDDDCERPELEQFFSRLAYVSGTPVIIVDPDTARVIIDDSRDCGKYCFIRILLPCVCIQLEVFVCLRGSVCE